MVKETVRWAAVFMLIAVIIGCGGQKPAQTPQAPKPVEPAFVAQLKTLDTMFVASKSLVGPYSGTGQAIGELLAWMEKNKVPATGAPFGIFMDNPAEVKPESTRFKVCVPVPAGTKSDKQAGITIEKFGGMLVAATEYIGPYDKVQPTYEKLTKWINENNYQIAGPGMEFYLSDPAKTPPESLRTEVCFPVNQISAPEK